MKIDFANLQLQYQKYKDEIDKNIQKVLNRSYYIMGEEISLLDIYEAIEGHINTHICIGNKMVCPFKKCVFGDLSNRLTLEFKNYMQSHSLAEYIDNQYI